MVFFIPYTHTHGENTLEKKTIMSIENGLQMPPAPPTPTPTEATTTTTPINEEENLQLNSSFLNRATITFIIIFVLTILYFLHAICCNLYAFCWIFCQIITSSTNKYFHFFSIKLQLRCQFCISFFQLIFLKRKKAKKNLICFVKLYKRISFVVCWDHSVSNCLKESK